MTEELTERQAHVVSLLPASSQEIGDALGVSASTAKDHISAIRERDVRVEYDRDAGVYFLKDEPEKRRLSTKHKGSITREANEFRTELEALLLRRLRGKDPLFADPEANEGNADFVVAMGDLHVGDKEEDERGEEIYNPDIAAASAGHVTQSALNRKAFFERGGVEFDTGHLAWIGDMVTGESIYSGQAYDIKLKLADQFSLGVEVLVQQAESLAQEFETLVITAVQGNHGEIRSGYDSGQANLDLCVYRAVADRLIDRGHDNILMNIGEAKHYRNTPLREGKWNLHVRHGQNGQEHVDATAASSRDWRGIRDKFQMDAAVRGHFHTYAKKDVLNQYPVITLPSPKPGGSFAEKIGSPDCSTHRKLGVSWMATDDRVVKDEDAITDHELDVEEIRTPTIDEIKARSTASYEELAAV